MFFIVNDSFVYGCISLFRCDKSISAMKASQRFAVAKAVIGISDGICNAFLRRYRQLKRVAIVWRMFYSLSAYKRMLFMKFVINIRSNAFNCLW